MVLSVHLEAATEIYLVMEAIYYTEFHLYEPVVFVQKMVGPKNAINCSDFLKIIIENETCPQQVTLCPRQNKLVCLPSINLANGSTECINCLPEEVCYNVNKTTDSMKESNEVEMSMGENIPMPSGSNENSVITEGMFEMNYWSYDFTLQFLDAK